MEDYVPIFKGYAEHCHDLLVRVVSTLLQPHMTSQAAGRPAYDLQWGLCIFDDLIEAGKQVGANKNILTSLNFRFVACCRVFPIVC